MVSTKCESTENEFHKCKYFRRELFKLLSQAKKKTAPHNMWA